MGTIIKESAYISAIRGSRPGNCTNGFSGFSNIDPPERVAPDAAKAPRQSEDVFAEQRGDQLSVAAGGGAGASLGVPLRNSTPADALTSALTSAGQESSAQATEEPLIDRILSGQQELFMDLVRPHQRTVYATVFSLLANKEDAEDVAQDTLVKALARLHQFRRESTFGTWLIQIAINETRMRNRKQWRVPMMSLTHN